MARTGRACTLGLSTSGIVVRTPRRRLVGGRRSREIEKSFEAQRSSSSGSSQRRDLRGRARTRARSRRRRRGDRRPAHVPSRGGGDARRPRSKTAQLLAVPLVTADVVVTNGVADRPLARVAERHRAWRRAACAGPRRAGDSLHAETVVSGATCCASPATAGRRARRRGASATSNVRRARPTSCSSASAC